MAIVKTEDKLVDGAWFKRKIKCSAAGIFSCELPDYVAEDLGLDVKQEAPSGKSMGECLVSWAEKVKEYEKRTTTKTKVICFHFDRDISFSEGLSLSVAARVMEETTITHRNGKKVYNYDDVDDDLPHQLTQGYRPAFRGEYCENQIPWTPEAEQFFTDLANAMEQLIEKLEGITTTPESVIKFIETGVKLLPGK